MARKDVELVIRAKDEAAKAVNSVTTAINSLVQAQAGLGKSADQSSNTLEKLGAVLGDLDRAFRGLDVGQQIARQVDNASKAVERLQASVSDTEKELTDLTKATRDAEAATAKLKADSEAAAKAIEREAAALEKAKKAALDQSAAISQATRDRRQLAAAEERLTGQIADQQARLDKSIAKYNRLGQEIAAAERPSKTLANSQEAAARSVENNQRRLSDLVTTLGAVRNGLGQTDNTLARFTDNVARAEVVLARQEATLAGEKQSYTALQGAVRSAGQQQRELGQRAEQVADQLDDQKQALDRAQAEFNQLKVSIEGTEKAMADFASGVSGQLARALQADRRAMLETRREWAQAEQQVKSLAATMPRIGPPAREQAVAWQQATSSARQARAEYMAQREGLARLAPIIRETGGDVAALRERQQRFAAVQTEVREKIARTREEAARSAAEFNKLAQATERASVGARRTVAPTASPPAKPVNDLADAYRRVYGESRQAMSITQRLRGEVLSLVSAYAGIYGVINLLGQTVDAYQKLEAAQSRLGAVFRNEGPERAAAELDFIRRNADRLGISYGQLADEYTKFAAATKGTNLEGEKTRKIFISVAEAARVNKLDFEDLQGVFRALTQIASKGRIQLEELSGQLGDRLPGALQIMADGLGITTEALLDLTKKGEVTSAELVGFAEELDKRYGKQLATALLSTTTALGQLENAAFQALLAFGNAAFIESFNRLVRQLIETLKSADFQAFLGRVSVAVSGLIDVLTVAVDNFDLLVVAITIFMGRAITPFILAIASAIRDLSYTLRGNIILWQTASSGMAAFGATTTAAAASTGRLTLALRALMSSTGIGLAITAISVGLGVWATRADAATDAMTTHRAIVDEVRNAYERSNRTIDDWSKKIKNVTVTQTIANLNKLRQALEEIQDIQTPGLTRNRGAVGPVNAALEEERATLRRLNAEWRAGTRSVDSYRKALDSYAQLSTFEVIRDIATSMIEASDAAIPLEESVRKAEAVLKVLQGTATDADKAVLGLGPAFEDAATGAGTATKATETYQEAVDKLKAAIPELADELKKLKALAAIEEAYQSALRVARTIGEANAAFEFRQRAIAGVNAEFDKDAYGDAAKALAGFTDGLEAASDLIRRREGFIPDPKRDTDGVLRIGFGSDTVTLSDGSVEQVVAGMRVTYADALRDLDRRMRAERQEIAGQIGANRFAEFNAQQQAVLTSIAYNYGKLPDRIVKAILGGKSIAEIADVIKALGNDNPEAGFPNRGRRAEEAFIFRSGVGEEAVVKEREKAAEEEQKRIEKAKEYNEELRQRLELQAVENANNGKLTEAAFVQKAVYDEQKRAKEAGVTLDDAQLAKIRELAAVEYQRLNTNRENKDELKEANEALALATALQRQQAALEAEIKQSRAAGDSTRTGELQIELDQVNVELDKAIAKARAMWEAIGGPAADVALAKLDTLRVKAATVAQSTFLNWKDVGDLFGNGLVNAFGRFTQALAEGKKASEAARDAFLQFAADFLREIAQMILKKAIFNALNYLFPGFGFGATGGTVAHTGGVIGRAGLPTRFVDASAWVGAPRFHSGYTPGFAPGEVPAILKKDEEVLTSDNPRHIFNQTGGAGAAPVLDAKIMNFIDSGDFVSEGMKTNVGQRAVLNFIRANAATIRQIVTT